MIRSVPIIAEVRAALLAANVSLVHLETETGIHRVNLSQFKSGTRKTLPVEQLEALANALGLEITVKESKKNR